MNHHQRMFAGCIVLSTVLFLFQCLLVVVVVVVPQAQAFAPTTTPASFLSKTTATAVTRRTSLLQLFASADDDNTNNMSFDMNELRQRIDQEYASYVPIEGAYMTKERQRNNERPTPEKVHVVVIHAGTINQGAHTIEYPKGSGNNVILAFESLEACRKFAASLEEQHLFADPTVRIQERKERMNSWDTSLSLSFFPPSSCFSLPSRFSPYYSRANIDSIRCKISFRRSAFLCRSFRKASN